MALDDQRIDDPDELLYRQVHPSCFPDGQVGSNAFNPYNLKVEPDRLSVARSSRTTAAEAFGTHIQQGKRSVGTWAVSVAECTSIGVVAYADPTEADPAHAFISFADFTKQRAREVAHLLKAAAVERGPLFRPETE
jgi:hypothetical protein